MSGAGRQAAVAAAVGAVGGLACERLGHGTLVTGPVTGALAGALLAWLVHDRVRHVGEGLIWSLAWCFLVWLAVPAGVAAAWSSGDACQLSAVRAHAPELIAYLVCIGTPLGIALGLFAPREPRARGDAFGLPRTLIVGALAGIAGSWVFGNFGASMLSPLPDSGAGRALHVATAATIGASYGWLFERARRGLGTSMGWGLAYGMLWWCLGPMTLLPLSRGEPVDWSVDRAAAMYGLFVGHVFFGLLLGLVHAFVDRVWQLLFVESDPLLREPDGAGARLTLALAWGAVAGLAGGLVFALAMADTGILPYVAGLVGGSDPWLGFAVHLVLSIVIGMTFGMLFARQATDFALAVGWGLVYGLLWWFLGQLTLFPALLGEPFDWSIEGASTALPSLVGHLAYGVVTATVFAACERRYLRRQAIDPRFRGRGDRRHASSPAPALWVFALGLGVSLPIVLG